MNKIILILLFFLSSCGYQPVYLNKNIENFEFQKITFEGDKAINGQITNTLTFKEIKDNKNLDKLLISSSYQIEQASKNAKGQVRSFRTIVRVNLEIRNLNDNIIKNKSFSKEFSYNNKENKFELVEYQNSIKRDLINNIITEIIIYFNS